MKIVQTSRSMKLTRQGFMRHGVSGTPGGHVGPLLQYTRSPLGLYQIALQTPQ